MTHQEIDTFEKLHSQLISFHTELTSLSKKEQNGPVNEFKLRFINALISKINSVLGEKYRPFEDFAQFDSDTLPSNSDVTMILGQYLGCMEKMRADNIFIKSAQWYWRSGEQETNIKTSAPQKIK